jgi:hypothetical protein
MSTKLKDARNTTPTLLSRMPTVGVPWRLLVGGWACGCGCVGGGGTAVAERAERAREVSAGQRERERDKVTL